MKTAYTRIASALFGVAILGATTSAAAQDNQLYDWPDKTAPVVVTTPNGALYLHKDGTPYRAYSYSPNKIKGQPSMVAVNMDNNGGPELVGIGKPSFAISADGAPLWSIDKGCKQGLIANIFADEKLELMCVQGNEIKVFTHDNQFAWGLSLGRSFGTCSVGDTNGDLKADIECKIGSKIARVDGAKGQLISAEATESMIPDGNKNYESLSPVDGAASLEDKTTHDFNGDGTAEEFVQVIDTALGISSKSSSKPLFVVELKQKPEAVLVKDLDGDKKPEVIAMTKKELFVISSNGKEVSSYSLDIKKYKRKPLAEFDSIYPNDFQDQEAAVADIKKRQADLSKCYTSALKKDDFAGSGRLLLKLEVDEKGKPIKAGSDFSEVDKKVVQCVTTALKKGQYTPAAAGKTANINLTLRFTFRDQDR